jgi:hypothetical protein
MKSLAALEELKLRVFFFINMESPIRGTWKTHFQHDSKNEDKKDSEKKSIR